MEVSRESAVSCPCCGKEMRQESDVLDTWFSSALWPFSTLGWPENTQELDYYYPTSTLVTGYDIIPFWVSRMIVMGMEMRKERPFETVFIHGLVRDAQGRKMSKSLGNGIDPLEIIDKYGADALRFALATGNSPGNDMRFSDEKIEAARNFNNKIWNAARFVLMNLELEEISLPDAADLEIEDKWILSRLNTVTKEVCDNLDHYELGIALAKLYDFVWSEFCDWYIELLKPRFADKGSKTNVVAQNTIGYVLIGIMKLLHPYMPFITEEIYASLPTLKEETSESIMISTYPAYKEELSFVQDEERMEKLIDLIRAIRNRRAEMNVPPSKKAQLYVVSERSDVYNENTVRFFEKLASASSVTYCAAVEDKTAVQIVAGGATVFIPMGDLVDLEKEKVRLAGEVKKVQGEIARLDGKLSNAGFIAKAPAAVVEGEKAKLEKYKETLAQLEEALSKI
jgi:valyl-tRNA synthetase